MLIRVHAVFARERAKGWADTYIIVCSKWAWGGLLHALAHACCVTAGMGQEVG